MQLREIESQINKVAVFYLYLIVNLDMLNCLHSIFVRFLMKHKSHNYRRIYDYIRHSQTCRKIYVNCGKLTSRLSTTRKSPQDIVLVLCACIFTIHTPKTGAVIISVLRYAL